MSEELEIDHAKKSVKEEMMVNKPYTHLTNDKKNDAFIIRVAINVESGFEIREKDISIGSGPEPLTTHDNPHRTGTRLDPYYNPSMFRLKILIPLEPNPKAKGGLWVWSHKIKYSTIEICDDKKRCDCVQVIVQDDDHTHDGSSTNHYGDGD